MKKTNGITLIALVVTIIVILILAGVTISLTIGNAGIITRAMNSTKIYEWGIISEQLRLKIDDYSLNKRPDLDNKTYLEYLFEDGYINLDSIVQIDKFNINTLRYGKGNMQNGDVYYIDSEKLYYMDEDGTIEKIDDLSGIGTKLPSFLFWNVSADDTKINLDNTNTINLKVANYNEKETTRADLQYNIKLLKNSTDLYSVKVDDKELTKEMPYELPIIQGNEQKSVVHKISVQPKQNAINTEEKIILQVYGKTDSTMSKEDVQDIEINIMPKGLYWNTGVSANEVELNVDNAKLSIVTQNYENNNITTSNIEYEISLENKENNPFSVSIGDTELGQSNYQGTINGGSKNQTEDVVTIKKQDGVPIATNEKIQLKIKIKSPIITERSFVINVKQYYLIDYSGNGYHGKLMNGAEIVKENGKYAIKLDGKDDYVQLPTISGSHNWKNGIDIEGTFKCNEISNNGHILILSNSSPTNSNLSDQIMVKINNNEANIHFEASTKGTIGSTITNNTTTNFALGEEQTFKVDMIYRAGFYYPIYLNGKKASADGLLLPVLNYVKNVERSYNYIGKSPFNNSYFNGNIYNLSLNIDGESKYVFKYDVNR